MGVESKTIKWLLQQSGQAHPTRSTTPPSTSTSATGATAFTFTSKSSGASMPAVPIISAKESCHDAAEGDTCWTSLRWVAKHGIIQQPSLYPNLSQSSSHHDIQKFLHLHGHGNCPPPCMESALPGAGGEYEVVQRCRAVRRGEYCDRVVRWAMRFGIKLHPKRYHGLSDQSSFEDFQRQMHQSASKVCPAPCTADRSRQRHGSAAVDSRISQTSVIAEEAAAALQVPAAVTKPTVTPIVTTTAAVATRVHLPTRASLPVEVSSDRLQIPSLPRGVGHEPKERVMYMYRAQSDADYPMENVNAADVSGVLWYLHNEVVSTCPRKNNITRILRYKVTFRKPMMGFVAFDSGKCTVAHCGRLWQSYGFAVGCQDLGYGADYKIQQNGLHGHWYSLPGPCPSQERLRKDDACRLKEPGGACQNLAGARNCVYHVEHAGEIRLDELEGIEDYHAFCQAGNLEYSKVDDKGWNLSFWDGKADLLKCRWRYNMVMRAFRQRYPNMPDVLGSSSCQ